VVVEAISCLAVASVIIGYVAVREGQVNIGVVLGAVIFVLLSVPVGLLAHWLASRRADPTGS